MSKALIICCRIGSDAPLTMSDLQKLSFRILPDNCDPPPPMLVTESGISLGLLNPNPCVLVNKCSVCLGSLFDEQDLWHVPGTNSPDGSYAIMRSDSNYVELLTDVVASRTLWYYKDDDFFIASTTQRAIIALIGSFTFNNAVIPWMLSTGTLGPGLSWDSRIKPLRGDSVLTLDRNSWEINVNDNECTFNPDKRSDSEHLKELDEALGNTFASIDIDFSRWALPLSGGYDSRAILFMLGMPADLRCITWGQKSSLSEKRNDAYVARELASKYKLRHQYFESSSADEPVDIILDRFLANSDGRIDHISGYLDGFKIWNELSQAGMHGIIRGDEGFGWSDVSSENGVRTSIGLTLLSDFSDWDGLQNLGLDLDSQSIPESLERRSGETLAMWRDRLYHEFRIPTILAALSDPKLSYVELINPLLSKRIIKKVRSMPDHLRTEKQMFRSIVRSFDKDIGFARFSAIEDPRDYLRHPEVVAVIKKELQSQYEMNLLPDKFLDHILQRISHGPTDGEKRKRTLVERVKPFLPSFVKKALRSLAAKKTIDPFVLTFRVYIICRLNRLLTTDADVFK